MDATKSRMKEGDAVLLYARIGQVSGLAAACPAGKPSCVDCYLAKSWRQLKYEKSPHEIYIVEEFAGVRVLSSRDYESLAIATNRFYEMVGRYIIKHGGAVVTRSAPGGSAEHPERNN